MDFDYLGTDEQVQRFPDQLNYSICLTICFRKQLNLIIFKREKVFKCRIGAIHVQSNL